MMTPVDSRFREQGNALFMTLVLLTLLAGLSMVQFSSQQKNLKQSSFYLARTGLHKFAEAGLALAIHQIRYDLSEDPGNIGTELWDVTVDHGRDGVPGTADEGEGDGLPTPGEAGVFPVPIGPDHMGTTFHVHAFDTGFEDVLRLVATAFDGESIVHVEKYLHGVPLQIPPVGAMYADPDVALDLNGNSFMIDGNDHDVNGNPTGGDPLPALTTSGDENAPGENSANLLSQISPQHYDQLLGLGGEASVGEVEAFDVNALIEAFKSATTNELDPGNYSKMNTGELSEDNIAVTYVPGDLHLSGNGEGSGVLVVDGNLEMSGHFSFTGLVIVRGDIVLTGGGYDFHVLGSTIIGNSVTADDDGGRLTVSGTTDLFYSREVMDIVQRVLDDNPRQEGVYYDENRQGEKTLENTR